MPEHPGDCYCIECEAAWYERQQYEAHLDEQALREAQEDEDRRVMQADFERGIYERADAEIRAPTETTTSNGEGQ